MEDVYKLGLDDLSWVELEVVCVDANADVSTPSPLNALYPVAAPPRIRIPNNKDEAARKAAAIHRLVAQDMERPLPGPTSGGSSLRGGNERAAPRLSQGVRGVPAAQVLRQP